MTDLRKSARGQTCMVRSPVCNFDPTTTVLAHYRAIGISGLGLKSPDLLAAFACSACHDLIDGRRHLDGWDKNDVRLVHLSGVIRTQAEWIRQGVVRW